MLIRLIDAGKIRTFEDLKTAYRRAILRTHPDAVGSDRHLEIYMSLRSHYNEARAYLAAAGCAGDDTAGGSVEGEATNHRLAFFRQLHLIETLEMPYAFHREENLHKLVAAKKTAKRELSGWRNDLVGLYGKADREYVELKTEKPYGPYLTHALALNVRPLMHNLAAFHLTGKGIYARQAHQNLPGIMHQLAEKGCHALREFLALLLDDLENGAAILEMGNHGRL